MDLLQHLCHYNYLEGENQGYFQLDPTTDCVITHSQSCMRPVTVCAAAACCCNVTQAERQLHIPSSWHHPGAALLVCYL